MMTIHHLYICISISVSYVNTHYSSNELYILRQAQVINMLHDVTVIATI